VPDLTLLDILLPASRDQGGDGISRTALLVDLPAARTLPLAPALSRAGLLVVPVIHRWCATRAVLPSDELLALLQHCSREVRPPRRDRGAAFLLDGDRAGPARLRRGSRPLRRFDNRYAYGPHALPPPAALRQEGIDRVMLVTRGVPAQDLERFLGAATRADMVVDSHRMRG
jgi:hypothetical protein